MSESSQDVSQERSITQRGLGELLDEFGGSEGVFNAAPQVSVNVLFEQLAHPGRRYVLTYLLLRDEFVPLPEMVDFVTDVAREPDSDGSFREEVVAELVETHLPKLDEADLVDYRIERQFIGPTDATPATLPYLSLASEHVQRMKPDDN